MGPEGGPGGEAPGLRGALNIPVLAFCCPVSWLHGGGCRGRSPLPVRSTTRRRRFLVVRRHYDGVVFRSCWLGVRQFFVATERHHSTPHLDVEVLLAVIHVQVSAQEVYLLVQELPAPQPRTEVLVTLLAQV